MKKITIILTVLITIAIKANAQIPNSGFENWTTVGSYENANGWGTPNDACGGPFYRITKSTDNYPVSIGTYSIRMENNVSLLPNYCAWGFEQTQQGTNGTTQFSITGHPTSLTGYYKFLPQNGDTMGIYIQLFNAGSLVSSGNFQPTIASQNWISFNIPLSIYSTADSATIALSALFLGSAHPMPHGSSVLYVDNLNFDNLITTGISEVNESPNISAYPNPFSTRTALQSDKSLQNATIIIYNSFGQEVKQVNNISGQKITLQRDNLPSGIYFIRFIQDNKTLATEKLIITDN